MSYESFLVSCSSPSKQVLKMLKLCILFFLTFNKCLALLQPVDNFSSELSRFICETSYEASKNGIDTIGILKLKNNFPSPFFDELYKCMPVNVAVIQLDLRSEHVEIKLKNVKFVIVIGDNIDLVSFLYFLKLYLFNIFLSHFSQI